MVTLIPLCKNLMHWWYVDGTTFMVWIHGPLRRMLNGRLRSTTWQTISWVARLTQRWSKMVPSVVHSKLSYAFMVITSLMISASLYPSYLMNFKVHRFKVDPLSIMTHLIAKSKTIIAMWSGRMWSGSTARISVFLKDKAHEAKRWPTKLQNSVVFMLEGTHVSCRVLSRISL